MNEEMPENLVRRSVSLAAALRTDWMGESRTLGRPIRKRVTVVYCKTDEGMDCCSHGGGGDRFTDSSKEPKLIVRGTQEVNDMFRENKRTIL